MNFTTELQKRRLKLWKSPKKDPENITLSIIVNDIEASEKVGGLNMRIWINQLKREYDKWIELPKKGPTQMNPAYKR